MRITVGFESGGDGEDLHELRRKVAFYFAEELHKSVDLPLFGFPAGSCVLVGYAVESASARRVSGFLTFEIEDILGNAAFAVSGHYQTAGFVGRPILLRVRDSTRLDQFDNIDLSEVTK